MNAYTPGIERMMKRLFDSLRENDRRRYAAIEATKLGHGGVEYIARVLGCDPKTIGQGQTELEEGDDLDTGRVRKKATAKNGARTEQGCFVSFRPALSKTWRPTGTIRRSIQCPTAGQPTPTSDSGNLTCWTGIAPLAGA